MTVSNLSMTTPSEIADLVLRTAQDGDINERPGHLVFQASLDDFELRHAWLMLRGEQNPLIHRITIAESDSNDDLRSNEAPRAGQRYRITVETARTDGQLHLYLARSLSCHADIMADSNVVLVAEMRPIETFATHFNRFQAWTTDPVEPFATTEAAPNPKSCVNDFTGGGEVPSDIRPWIARNPPEVTGTAYLAWSRLAGRHLLAAVCDRISREADSLTYHFSGPPACKVAPSDDQIATLFSKLQAGASWVFLNAQDADTRHLLLAAEWARTCRDGDVCKLGEGSLESAQAAYKAYVVTRSKEALKALADLRKAVIDESQKVAQRAQDLAGSMWKDLAVSATPFVLKTMPDTSKAASTLLTGVLAICAAVFIAFSFGIQVYINRRYFQTQKDARAVWKRSVNLALRQEEVDEFSEVPIRRSIQDYRKVRFAVGIVYAALFLALLAFGTRNLSTNISVQRMKAPQVSSANTIEKQPPPAATATANPNVRLPPASPTPTPASVKEPSKTAGAAGDP